MTTLSGIYDSAPMQPIAKIKDNLSIWTLGKWQHFRVDYLEPLAPGPAMVVDTVASNGATSIAANGTINHQIVTILQLNDSEFLHIRFRPLDPVEGLIWEQAGQQKFAARNVHTRVDMSVSDLDPYWATTTFFVFGINRDMNLETRNPPGYALPQARFQFWGNRMILTQHPKSNDAAVQRKLEQGDLEVVRATIGVTTWLPAEGRSN